MFKFVRDYFHRSAFSYRGHPGELVVDEDTGTLRVHNGDTIGGIPAHPGISTNITPKVGGGVTDSPQLSYGWNALNPGFGSGDSVQLPPAVANATVVVFTTGISSSTTFIWPNGSDTMNNNGVSAAIYLPQPSGFFTSIPALFVCNTDGNWLTNVSDLDL